MKLKKVTFCCFVAYNVKVSTKVVMHTDLCGSISLFDKSFVVDGASKQNGYSKKSYWNTLLHK